MSGICHHLASQTGLTDGVRLGGGGDFETSDKVVPDHPLEDRVAWVTEAMMPEFQVHWRIQLVGQVPHLCVECVCVSQSCDQII